MISLHMNGYQLFTALLFDSKKFLVNSRWTLSYFNTGVPNFYLKRHSEFAFCYGHQFCIHWDHSYDPFFVSTSCTFNFFSPKTQKMAGCFILFNLTVIKIILWQLLLSQSLL